MHCLQGAHEMVLEMVAWRDPNLVPIKAFYGDDLKINYCGKLATDTHVQVHSTARTAAALGPKACDSLTASSFSKHSMPSARLHQSLCSMSMRAAASAGTSLKAAVIRTNCTAFHPNQT